jgi:uncharacterized membrane protein
MDGKTTITALYDRTEDAQKALRELQNMNISRDDISLVASNATGEYSRENGGRGLQTDGDTGEGAVAGAAVGGMGGLVVGLAALAIPGIGPVLAAGPIASALVAMGIGAGIGAVTGGLVGALTDFGMSEEKAGYYAEGVRRGGTLLTAHVPENMSSRVMDMLNRHNAIDVEERASHWRESGWQGYDPKAEPFGAEEIGRERSQYGVGNTRGRGQQGIGGGREQGQHGIGGIGGGREQGQHGVIGDTREQGQRSVTPMTGSAPNTSE